MLTDAPTIANLARRLAAVAALSLVATATLPAQPVPTPIPVPPPPMGWSSWNSFSNTIDSQIAMAQAKAMAANGMQKAGYRYINIDEGWWLGARDAQGNILVDPKAWPAIAAGEQPGDMANIVRYIHSLGLKAGIYTDAGRDGCSTVGPDLGPSYPNTGSEGHYEQDFLQFAKWGFDYVKVDWCGGYKENLDPAVQYAEIARAIARAESMTGHRLYYSICNWGKESPFTWAPNVGGVEADIWRTGGDIVAPIVANTKNAGRKAELKEVLREFDQAQHPQAQHTGYYNDPDMMVVGMPGLSEEQNRVHMSLWAISGGPLLVGADLTRLSPADLATLTNPDAIQIDQDQAGLQSILSSQIAPGLEVWSKPLSTSGTRAVVLLNRTSAPAAISVRWSDLALRDDAPVSVRDVWAAKDLGAFQASYSATVPAADAVLLLVHGAETPATTYVPALSEQHDFAFQNVHSRFPVARLQIQYANPGNTPRFAELRVNGQDATKIAFPPTGNENALGTIVIEAAMDGRDGKNRFSFSSPNGPAPAIRSITVQ
jgi:hypothetical protein